MSNTVETKNLYRFHWDCGRQGDLTGIFAATQVEVDGAIGKQVYFGEVLGKHSDISGTLDAGEIELVTGDSGFVNKAIEYGLVPTGFNPLDYLNEEE